MKRFGVSLVLFIAVLTTLGAWPLAWTPVSGALGKIERPNTATKPVLSGTIWNGEIRGLEPVGTMRYSLSPMRKLKGGSLLSFSTRSRAIVSRGTGDLSGVKNVMATGDLAWILPTDRRFGGIGGAFDMTLEALHFRMQDFESGCTEASGQFNTDVLQANEAIWKWVGPNLSGPITCVDGDLITRLSGQDRTQSIDVFVTMKADGIYAADVRVQTQEPGADAVLGLYGFSKSGQDFNLRETGKWR